ncbi:MAG: hypothetical protein QM764_10215 [Chitinophagaceae bacterium]
MQPLKNKVMDDLELKQLWQSYDQKLEEARILNMQSWALNLKSFEMMQTQKAKSKLKSLQRLKLVIAFGGVVWSAILLFLFFNSLEWQKVFFSASVGIVALFNILAVILYIRHMVLIYQIDNSENIIETQTKLATLQQSTINTGRILWLQMPFYTTFFWSPAFFHDIKSWLISIPITLIFAFLSFWLFRNIKPENANKKWFRFFLFDSPEWTSVNKAIGFLKEIEDFKANM